MRFCFYKVIYFVIFQKYLTSKILLSARPYPCIVRFRPWPPRWQLALFIQHHLTRRLQNLQLPLLHPLMNLRILYKLRNHLQSLIGIRPAFRIFLEQAVHKIPKFDRIYMRNLFMLLTHNDLAQIDQIIALKGWL